MSTQLTDLCVLLLQAREIEERYLRRQQRRAELEAKRKEREDEKAVEREQRRQRRLAAAATAQRKEAIRGGATRSLSIFWGNLLKCFVLEKFVKFVLGDHKNIWEFSINLIINNSMKYFNQSQLNTFM